MLNTSTVQSPTNGTRHSLKPWPLPTHKKLSLNQHCDVHKPETTNKFIRKFFLFVFLLAHRWFCRAAGIFIFGPPTICMSLYTCGNNPSMLRGQSCHLQFGRGQKSSSQKISLDRLNTWVLVPGSWETFLPVKHPLNIIWKVHNFAYTAYRWYHLRSEGKDLLNISPYIETQEMLTVRKS